MSQQLNNDQFYQKFGNHSGWVAGWGMWDIKDNIKIKDFYFPEILQMVKLDIFNSKNIIQESMLGTSVGLNPVRDPCLGDSGETFTLKQVGNFFLRQAHTNTCYHP